MTTVFERTRSAGEIIAGMTRGDVDCASDFHARYGARISRLVWSLLGADRDHDDVVQIVFVALLDSVHSVRDPLRLDWWVDSVVFRTVRKELRSRRYRRLVTPASDALPEVIDRRTPEAELVAKRFYAAMDRMKAEERMLFVLKYFENHSLTEMAQISGWSVATVKRRIDNATESFRKIAGEDSVLASCMGDRANVGS